MMLFIYYLGRRRPVSQSGSSDSGWIRLENGTMVRSQKSWSKTTSYETSYGGVQLNPDERDELAAQLALGEVHDNTNEISDETDDDKSKSWSDLDEMKRRVDAKMKALSEMPTNVEPGFEEQYRASGR